SLLEARGITVQLKIHENFLKTTRNELPLLLKNSEGNRRKLDEIRNRLQMCESKIAKLQERIINSQKITVQQKAEFKLKAKTLTEECKSLNKDMAKARE
ncbi:MAG: hypothetical protein ABIF92_02860, partial [archaeon]